MRELLLETFNKWLHIEDIIPLDVVMGTALASRFLDDDPIWLILCGSSGIGKTELIRGLTGDKIYQLDTLTARSLISGLNEKGKKKGSASILPDLNHKLLVIKDFTEMLRRSETNPKDDAMSLFRGSYDGYLGSAFGSGLKNQSYKSTFGIIAATTEVVDSFKAQSNNLGERFITVRMTSTDNFREKLISKADEDTENIGMGRVMRQELTDAMMAAFDYYDDLGHADGLPTVSPNDREKIVALVDVISAFRTEVRRDRFGKIEHVPHTEIGGRLLKQLKRLAQMLDLYGAYSYSTITRVARDCLTEKRLSTLRSIYQMGTGNPHELYEMINRVSVLKTTYSTVQNEYEDLWSLGLLDLHERGLIRDYSIKQYYLEKMITSGIFDSQ